MLNHLHRHIKKLAMLVFFICSGIYLQAQVNIEFNAINEYVFNTREALNLIVVNNNTKAFPVMVQGKITDAVGQTVAEFKSSEVMLNIGSNIITPMNTSLSDVNYFNQDIAEIESRTGTYPSGNYHICVWLICVSQDCGGAGQNAASVEQVKCTQVHIENPTPLILATPENDSEIEETRPMFTWIPPSPVAGSANLNYSMILVEIMEGQNKSDALSINRPLIEMEGIAQPSLMFPSDLPELEKGKTYAWQVQAFVGKTPIAKSEQWKFKIKKEEKKKDSSMYAVVSRNMDAAAYRIAEDGFLYFVFNDSKPTVTLNYEIMKSNLELIKSSVLKINYDEKESREVSITDLEFIGFGKFKINVGALNLRPGYYYLHIISQDKEHFYLKFQIQ